MHFPKVVQIPALHVVWETKHVKVKINVEKILSVNFQYNFGWNLNLKLFSKLEIATTIWTPHIQSQPNIVPPQIDHESYWGLTLIMMFPCWVNRPMWSYFYWNTDIVITMTNCTVLKDPWYHVVSEHPGRKASSIPFLVGNNVFWHLISKDPTKLKKVWKH